MGGERRMEDSGLWWWVIRVIRVTIGFGFRFITNDNVDVRHDL